MKKLAIILATVVSAFGQQYSYDLNVVATVTMGSSVGGSMWVEYDLHSKDGNNFTAPSQTIDITEVNNSSFLLKALWNTSNQLDMQSWRDTCTSSNDVQISLANKRAVGVIIRRDRVSSTEGTVTFEVWDKEANPATGFGAYTITTRTCTAMGSQTFSSIRLGEATSHNMALGLFRLRTGTPIAAGGNPPHARAAGATSVNLTFDSQNGTESNGKTTNFTSATYTATPTYAPICDAGDTASYRAGAAMTLDGTGSWANDADAGTLTYQWVTTAKPATASLWWNSNSVAQPSITGTVANIGESDPMYRFDLVVTQADGQTDSCYVEHGVVATDDNRVVITGNSDIDYLLGPMIQYGQSAWPGIDSQTKAQADYDMARLVDGDWSDDQTVWTTPNPAGTVTVTNGSGTIVGSSTTFQATFCGGGTTATTDPRWIVIHIPDPDAGTSDTLHIPMDVNTCASDTSVSTSQAWLSSWMDCPTGCSGLTYTSAYSGNVSAAWSGSFTNTFYDAPIAFYSLFRRSGYKAYKDNYRDLVGKQIDAPNWSRGYVAVSAFQGVPRTRNMTGAFLRLIEDPNAATNHWDKYINRYCSRLRSSVVGGVLQYQCCDREHAFEIKDLALCSAFDDLGTRSNYQDAIVHYLTDNSSIGVGFIPNKVRTLVPSVTDSSGDAWEVILDGLINTTRRVDLASGDATVTVASGATFNTTPGVYDDGYFSFCKTTRTNFTDCDSQVYKLTVTDATHAEMDRNWTVPSGWTCPTDCEDLQTIYAETESTQQYASYFTQPFMQGMIGKSFYQYVAPALRLDNYSDTHDCTNDGATKPCDETVEDLANGANLFMQERGFFPNGGMIYARARNMCYAHPDDPSLLEHGFYNRGLALGQWSRAAGNITNFVDSGTTGTITLTVNHGLSAGNAVWVTGVSDADANGFYVVQSTPTAQSFTVTTASVTDATYTTAAMAISTAITPTNLEARSTPEGCTQSINSNITQTFEAVSSLAFQYFKTGSSTLKTFFDGQMDIAMNKWGLPPGHSVATTTNYASDLELFGNSQSKYLGMLAGQGAAHQWAAVYAGLTQWPRTPTPRDIDLSAGIASNKVRFTIRDANGTQVDQDTCTSMPCTLTIADPDMGNHTVLIEHLTAGDVVVGRGSWQPLTLQ